MGKEIRVTGLENIQPISDRPGGTVYRGKRMAEIETIIKILPHPVDISRKDEHNTAVFLKEIKKLKHLNQVPNIHVVKILNTGLTENDSFPFIETERIKGPDLDELLTFPNNAVFRLEEAMDLAVQMSNALAHSHTALVKHGRINSSNIRLNPETGSYVLLNFGQALLTVEQRKSGFNEVRAAEYLAPEQENGELLFETDIYSLGVVLYQTLSGNLPQHKTLIEPVSEGIKEESNLRREIIKARKENLPIGWTDDEKTREMKIPERLFEVLAVCLEEEPSKRYSNGIKFQEALKPGSAKAKEETLIEPAVVLPAQTDIKTAEGSAEKLKHNKEIAKESSPTGISAIPVRKEGLLPAETNDVTEKELEIKRLKALVLQKDGQLDVYRYQSAEFNPDRKKLNISKPVFYSMLILLAGLGAFAVYGYFFRKPEPRGLIATYTDADVADTSSVEQSEMYTDSLAGLDTAALLKSMPAIVDAGEDIPQEPTNKEKKNTPEEAVIKKPVPKPTLKKDQSAAAPQAKKETEPKQNPAYLEPPVNRNMKYTLAVPKAYFYDKPDVTSRRPVYLANSNESELTATEDTNGFIYVVFFNTDREITRGWLRKQDLRRINQ